MKVNHSANVILNLNVSYSSTFESKFLKHQCISINLVKKRLKQLSPNVPDREREGEGKTER